jgi:hypothetical protein
MYLGSFTACLDTVSVIPKYQMVLVQQFTRDCVENSAISPDLSFRRLVITYRSIFVDATVVERPPSSFALV